MDSPVSWDPVSGEDRWAEGQGWGSVVQHPLPKALEPADQATLPSQQA